MLLFLARIVFFLLFFGLSIGVSVASTRGIMVPITLHYDNALYVALAVDCLEGDSKSIEHCINLNIACYGDLVVLPQPSFTFGSQCDFVHG